MKLLLPVLCAVVLWALPIHADYGCHPCYPPAYYPPPCPPVVDLYDGAYHWQPAGWWRRRWFPAGWYRWCSCGRWWLQGYGYCDGHVSPPCSY